MANTFVTPSIIAKEAAFQVVNNMVMGKLVNREFRNEFVKVGSSISYRKPVKFVVNDGADITSQIQDVTETTDTISIDQRKNVAFKIPTQDLTLTIEQISERYIKPAAIRLANNIDASGLARYVDVYNASGTAGTTPATFGAIGGVGQKMSEFAVPNMGRKLVVDPAAEYALPDGLKGILQPTIVSDIIKEAAVGRVAKFDIFGDQNVKAHTKGVATGTPLVNGASQTGASLATDGWTNSTTGILRQGDIFTIAGVNAVNPISYEDTGALQQFVVTADANSGATTGPATLSISPSISVTGSAKTVTALPADNAAITVVASHKANLGFHKNAFSLVTVPLDIAEDATGSRVEYEGVSMRYKKGYDIRTDEQIYRLDILYGWKTTYPELACRLLG